MRPRSAIPSATTRSQTALMSSISVKPGIAGQRVAPLAAVAGAAAVVDHHHAQAVIDPRLDGRRERVAVVRLRAAVDVEDRRVRPRLVGRLGNERVDRADPQVRVANSRRRRSPAGVNTHVAARRANLPVASPSRSTGTRHCRRAAPPPPRSRPGRVGSCVSAPASRS